METNPIQPNAPRTEPVAEHANGSFPARNERTHRTVDRLASAVHEVTDQVAARSEAWQALQDRMLAQARDGVRARPLAVVGLALFLGFVMSRLAR